MDRLDSLAAVAAAPVVTPTAAAAGDVSPFTHSEVRIDLAALHAPSVVVTLRLAFHPPLVVDVQSAKEGLAGWGRCCGHEDLRSQFRRRV